MLVLQVSATAYSVAFEAAYTIRKCVEEARSVKHISSLSYATGVVFPDIDASTEQIARDAVSRACSLRWIPCHRRQTATCRKERLAHKSYRQAVASRANNRRIAAQEAMLVTLCHSSRRTTDRSVKHIALTQSRPSKILHGSSCD